MSRKIISLLFAVPALLVTASIIIGGAMFGIAGMLLAPPIVAIISVIVMGNLELKENQMRYAMELNAERDRQRREQRQTSAIEKLQEESRKKKVINRNVRSIKKNEDTKNLSSNLDSSIVNNSSNVEKTNESKESKNEVLDNSILSKTNLEEKPKKTRKKKIEDTEK